MSDDQDDNNSLNSFIEMMRALVAIEKGLPNLTKNDSRHTNHIKHNRSSSSRANRGGGKVWRKRNHFNIGNDVYEDDDDDDDDDDDFDDDFDDDDLDDPAYSKVLKLGRLKLSFTIDEDDGVDGDDDDDDYDFEDGYYQQRRRRRHSEMGKNVATKNGHKSWVPSMIRRSSSSSTSKRGPKTKTTSTSTTNTTTTVISSINAKNQQIGKSTLSTMVSKNGKRHVRIVKTSSSMSKCNLLEKEMSRTSKDMVNSIGKQTACTAKINDTERAKVIDSVCQFRVKLLDTIKKHIVPKRQEKQQQQSTMIMVKQNESILNQKTIG